ncbi:MAG: HlyD family efflux transporter periplasmic adaptor subunit [Candidatus Nealsonbacteria bacterium]|nr:HlyD family efflux transporter periplasmic adaptor subunit [Candidatus Nealsonbacteria bacterium]
MKLHLFRVICCLVVLAVSLSAAISAEPPAAAKDAKEAAKPAPSTPTVHTVKKGTMKIEVSLDGVFEAQSTAEILLRPETWATLKVIKAVEHGTEVKKGDLLVSLDLDKIDRAIGDLRREHVAADVAIKLAQQALATLQQTTPMDMAAAQRAYDEAKELTQYYFKVTRPMSIKSAERSLQSAQFSLEYAEEELRQLEKMYKADDITEETEEIILTRTRRSVDSARYYLERTKLNHERTMKVMIPRRDVTVKEADRRADFALAGSKTALPLALQKAQMDMQTLTITRQRSEEKLQKLLADRAAMTITAPVGGIVYHGKAVRGKFSAGSKPGGLKRGASITAGDVFMTIVKPRPVLIRTMVAEKDVSKVAANVKGTVVPTALPDVKLTAIVQSVGAVPMSTGSFDVRISVAADAAADAIMPGMTCKVKLVPFEKKDAITVPAKAVETDEADDAKHYVYVVVEKDKSDKREVTIGKRTNGQVEIVKGLSEGDKILSEPPK